MTFLAAALENWRYVAAESHGFGVNRWASSSGVPARVDKEQQK